MIVRRALNQRQTRFPSVVEMAVLAIFVLGYFLTRQIFARYEPAYMVLHFLAGMVCLVLLRRIRYVSYARLPVLLAVAVFVIAYFGKFYLIAHYVFAGDLMSLRFLFGSTFPLYWMELGTETFWNTFLIASTTFIGVCVVFMKSPVLDQPFFVATQRWPIEYLKRNAVRYLMVAVWIGIFISLFRWYYDLDNPLRAEVLPLRLAGITGMANRIVTPMLFLMSLQYAALSRKRHVIALSIGALYIFCVIQYILTWSKSFLFLPLAYTGLLLFSIEKLERKHRHYILVAIAVLIVSYPYLNSIRSGIQEGSITDLPKVVWNSYMDFEEAKQSMGMDAGPLTGFVSHLSGIILFIVRLTGADPLLLVVASEPAMDLWRTIDLILDERPLNVIFASDIALRWETIERSGFSASLIGQTYMLTGSIYATVLGVIAFLLIVHLALCALGRWQSEMAACVYVVCVVMAYSWFSDGFELRFFTLGSIPLMGGVIIGRVARAPVSESSVGAS